MEENVNSEFYFNRSSDEIRDLLTGWYARDRPNPEFHGGRFGAKKFLKNLKYANNLRQKTHVFTPIKFFTPKIFYTPKKCFTPIIFLRQKTHFLRQKFVYAKNLFYGLRRPYGTAHRSSRMLPQFWIPQFWDRSSIYIKSNAVYIFGIKHYFHVKNYFGVKMFLT